MLPFILSLACFTARRLRLRRAFAAGVVGSNCDGDGRAGQRVGDDDFVVLGDMLDQRRQRCPFDADARPGRRHQVSSVAEVEF